MNRTNHFLAILLFALLTACAPDRREEQRDDQPKENMITGVVTYRQKMALPPNTLLKVKLAQYDAPNNVIAEKQIATDGKQIPFAFELEYPKAQISNYLQYAVYAEIVNGGKTIMRNTSPYEVLSNDKKQNIAVTVQPVMMERVDKFPKLTGRLMPYEGEFQLPPTAVISIQLQDVSLQDVGAKVLNEKTMAAAGLEAPISFELEYDPMQTEKRFTYALSVRIQDGDKLLYINDTQTQVINNGKTKGLAIKLKKVN